MTPELSQRLRWHPDDVEVEVQAEVEVQDEADLSARWFPLTVIGEGVVGWIMDTDDGIMLADTEANYIGTYATHAEVRAALEA